MNDLRLRTGKLSWREVDGEIIAVDLAASGYLSANAAGGILWQMLAAGTTRAALATRLVETFGIAPKQAEADVTAFLDELSARDLLET